MSLLKWQKIVLLESVGSSLKNIFMYMYIRGFLGFWMVTACSLQLAALALIRVELKVLEHRHQVGLGLRIIFMYDESI